MLTEIIIRGTLKMIKLKVLEYISTQMDQGMMGSGREITLMEKAKKYG
jgi:hypothetical protein